MGSISSKSGSPPSTPMKTVETKLKINIHKETAQIALLPNDLLLDPRSPNIARTPLTEIIANRLNINRFKFEQTVNCEVETQTPSNSMRKKLLRDLGYNYTTKELNLLDPRSPNLFIPRTPLNLSLNGDDEVDCSKAFQSLEYNGHIEEASCRNFNEKLANITLDDTDYEDAVQSKTDKDAETNTKTDGDAEFLAIRQKYMETDFDFVDDDIKLRNDPRSPSENIFRTPMLLAVPSKIPFHSDDEITAENNASPLPNDELPNGLPIFSSTPSVAKSNTVNLIEVGAEIEREEPICVKTVNIEKINNAKIYEDEICNKELINVVAIAEDILNTPVKKFMKTKGANENEKPRTPLSVINRRTKSAESLLQRQSRLRQNDESIKKSALKSKVKSSFAIANDENFTPHRSSMAVKLQKSSIRTNSSKIPIFKK